MSISGRDSRNNIRGSCEEHPDCLEYEWVPDIGLHCIFCGCLPVKHKIIEPDLSMIIVEQHIRDNNKAENSGNSNAVTSETSDDENVISLSDPAANLPSTSKKSAVQSKRILQLQRHTCVQCEQQVTLDYLIPDTFRPNLFKAINSGIINFNEQSEIIRIVSLNMIQHDKTAKDDAMVVAEALVKKIPALRGEFGSEYGGIEKALRDCIKRQKSKTTKNRKNNQQSDSDWQQEQRTIMEREVRKGNDHSKEILRKTLQETRECRIKERLSASKMLERYPAFKVRRMILWEFSDFYNISAAGMKRNWLDALPKILSILPTTSRVDANGQTIHVLLNLANKFHGKNKESRKPLLVIHKHGTPLENITPKQNEPPYFSAVGNIDDPELNLLGHVDGVAMFNDRPVEALLQLMAVYWVFNIKFHPTQKQPLLFISGCLFRKESSKLLGDSLAKALSVTKLLATAKIA